MGYPFTTKWEIISRRNAMHSQFFKYLLKTPAMNNDNSLPLPAVGSFFMVINRLTRRSTYPPLMLRTTVNLKGEMSKVE